METRTSNVSSTPTTVNQPLSVRPEVNREADMEMDPWTPLVLSLDGGGVRDLSTLYVLRRIMLRIRELEAEANGEQIPEENLRLPLPSHYFDNIVGVSTGGLIGIMLGRLRMDINDCIQQYYIICNHVFRPHKYIGHYSAQRFEAAINEVIKKHCKCHPQECQHPQSHKFRQYDYLEFDDDDDSNSPEVNGTCKVAVLSQRKAHGRGQVETVYMMRSYNHRRRKINNRAHSALNRGPVDESNLRIWEACRATSAAPLFFPKIEIEGFEHIDGGVGDNNPSTHAWNEVNDLTRASNRASKVAMLVSIGTGMTEPYTKFGGLLSLIQYAGKAITETEKAHEATRTIARAANSDYFRFDVRPIRDRNEDGLSKIKIDECKKTKKTTRPAQAQHQQNPSLPRDESHGEDSPEENPERARERELILARMDERNDLQASQKLKGGYKPGKYDYTTFQTIKDKTDKYCLSSRYSFPRHRGQQEAQNVRAEINQCARILFEHSQRRKSSNPARWARFRRHPDPEHEANRATPVREA